MFFCSLQRGSKGTLLRKWKLDGSTLKYLTGLSPVFVHSTVFEAVAANTRICYIALTFMSKNLVDKWNQEAGCPPDNTYLHVFPPTGQF